MLTWKELHTQFYKLDDPYGHVRLDIEWGTGRDYLHLSGYSSSEDKQRFVGLASLAGKKLREQLQPDTEINRYILGEENSTLLWYKALWMFSLAVKYGNVAFHDSADGDESSTVYTGSVPGVYLASANLALKCLEVLGDPLQDTADDKTGLWQSLKRVINFKSKLFGSSEDVQRIVSHNKTKND